MTYFENSVLFSTQLFWSPIVTEMYCMIADWGGGGRWCYMHFMSTLYYATFLDFLRTQHMTYFENTVLLFSAQLFGLNF